MKRTALSFLAALLVFLAGLETLQAADLKGGTFSIALPETWQGTYESNFNQLVLVLPPPYSAGLIIGGSPTNGVAEENYIKTLASEIGSKSPSRSENGTWILSSSVEEAPLDLRVSIEGERVVMVGLIGFCTESCSEDATKVIETLKSSDAQEQSAIVKLLTP